MSQSEKMNRALKKYAIQPLLDNGFTGDFPHYRKIYDNRVELLVIQKNKYGNSFTIEISTVYPQLNYPESNFMRATNNPDEQITVWNTNLRYRLQGKFDGWFYYTDVCKKHILFFGNEYLAVNEKNKKDIPKGYKLVQKESDELYIKLCSEINEQMKKAYKWWNKHQQP